MMEGDIVTLPSNYDVKITIDRLEHALLSKGVTIFSRIDQQGEAAKAGLIMKPLVVLIYGNPKAGTTLMQAEPLTSLDLPLKAMAWEDNENRVWLSYNSFAYLQRRFCIKDELIKPISAVEGLLRSIVQ